MTNKTFIISGATSFIGVKIVKDLLEGNNIVYALCRSNSKKLDYLPIDENLHIIEIEFDNIDQINKYIIRADIFINLAWKGASHEERDNDTINKTNIANTLKAMKVAKKIGCRMFVETGSQAEYGFMEATTDETAPCNPVSAYGRAKKEVQVQCQQLAKQIGIAYLHLRIFSIFGEQDHEYTLFKTCLNKMQLGEPIALSQGTQKWNFLYVDDASSIIIALIDRLFNILKPGQTEIVNVASRETRSLSEFVSSMKSIVNSESQLNFGEIKSERLLSIIPSTKKLFSIIGDSFPIRSFEEGVLTTIRRLTTTPFMTNLGNSRKKCILCNNPLDEEPMMQFENMPSSAQNIPDKDSIGNDSGIKLNLKQCTRCGLVQLDSYPVEYYRKVIRAGGGSSTMKELRQKEYSEFIERFDLKGGKIVEIGCGAGEFLKMWEPYEVDVVGVEYSKDLVDIARKNGLKVFNAFVDDPSIILPGAPYDAFCQFNFLEHQPYPNEMLQGIYNNLTNDGVGLVTVPSLEYILKYDGYYELIRDHLAYYSADTLRLLFETNGFEVISLKTVNRDTHEIMVRKRKQVNLNSWKQNYNTLKKEITEYIAQHGDNVAIWGASHQGFTLVPSLGIEDKVKYIIDSAKFKQGRYAPASHVPIVAPDHFHSNPVNAIIIVAPGYTDEIFEKIKSSYDSGVAVATLKSNHLERLR